MGIRGNSSTRWKSASNHTDVQFTTVLVEKLSSLCVHAFTPVILHLNLKRFVGIIRCLFGAQYVIFSSECFLFYSNVLLLAFLHSFQLSVMAHSRIRVFKYRFRRK